MGIKASQTAPNHVPGNYFRINSAQILCSPEEPVARWHIQVGFYVSREARDDPIAGRNPVWTHHVFKRLDELEVDPREGGSMGLYDIVMADPLFAGTNAVHDPGTDGGTITTPLVPAKVTRRQARQALLLAGLLDAVAPAIAALDDGTSEGAQLMRMVQIYWEDSTEFQRDLPILIHLARALSLDDAGLDQLFISAAAL